jgi:carboxymethylenebutenolidase
MCFDRDSSPPILAGTGRIGETGRVVLESADGTAFGAFAAWPGHPARATVLVLPDVRGLHPYYEELTCRFAEHGFRALAIDYFGRTAGSAAERPPGFEYHEHVDRTTYAGLTADVRAALAHLRDDATGPERDVFTIGFCFGGRLSFLASTFGLELAGVIGLHAGLGPRNDLPPPADVAGDMRSPVLGLFGGADPSIPPEAVGAFDAALTAAGVEHRFVTYAGAPHSFFDRKFDEFATQSAATWAEVLDFLGATNAAPV